MHICNCEAYERPKNLEGQLKMVVQIKVKVFVPARAAKLFLGWCGIFFHFTPGSKTLVFARSLGSNSF